MREITSRIHRVLEMKEKHRRVDILAQWHNATSINGQGGSEKLMRRKTLKHTGLFDEETDYRLCDSFN